MKKIPTLFKRDPGNMARVLPELAVKLPADAVATAKFDGSAVMYDGHRWWKRREVKPGKTPPPDFDEVDHDEVTGKRQGWVPVTDGPEDRWFRAAIDEYGAARPGTFEAVGPHFQGNPHGYREDILIAHGVEKLPHIAATDMDDLVELLGAVLADLSYEGIVWWVDGQPVAKLKRRDFGFRWPAVAS